VFTNGTVIPSVHCRMLIHKFYRLLMGCGMAVNLARFQQEGARSHISNVLLRFLHDIFEEKGTSNRHPALFDVGFSWPPSSPYLRS
jgi:hypothetical protein